MNTQDTTDIKQIDNKYGYSYDKFQTMQVNEVDAPEQAKHIKKRIQRLLKNGHIIFKTVHKDCHNSYFPVEATAKLGVYEGKQVILF